MSFAHFTESGFDAICDSGIANLQDNCPCGLWVAGGDYYQVAYSKNGINWLNSPTPLLGTFGIATNGLMWVSVGDGNQPRIASSPNGLDWTLRVSSGIGWVYDVAWNGSYWIATGSGDYEIWKSTDGINWTGVSLNDLEIASTWGIAWGDNKWVTFGVGISGQYFALISSDGINWTAHSISLWVNDIAWNGYLWVGSNSSSADGINWTQRTGVTRGIVWNGLFWLGVKTNAEIWKSTDGINWNYSASIDGFSLNDIAWNGNLFVAVGELSGGYSMIVTSPDGEIWSHRGDYFSNLGRCVASKPAPNLYPPIEVLT